MHFGSFLPDGPVQIAVGKHTAQTPLGIDQQKVEDAFTQARSEMKNEALDNYLKGLVEKGMITQEEADKQLAAAKRRDMGKIK